MDNNAHLYRFFVSTKQQIQFKKKEISKVPINERPMGRNGHLNIRDSILIFC